MVFPRPCLIAACLVMAACSPAPSTEPQSTPDPSSGLLAPARVTNPGVELPQIAEDLITDAEVSATSPQGEDGGHGYYDRHYQRPTWPGGDSGVTIGIGVDLGQQSAETTTTSWEQYLAVDVVSRLADCAGLTGDDAKSRTGEMQDISVVWPSAINEFNAFEVPNYWSLTARTFPGFENLRPNAQGALVSLVYNRGSSMAGPSRVDMRTIRAAVPNQDYDTMATAVRHMDVTMGNSWRNAGIYDGMAARREAEAQLILTP